MILVFCLISTQCKNILKFFYSRKEWQLLCFPRCSSNFMLPFFISSPFLEVLALLGQRQKLWRTPPAAMAKAFFKSSWVSTLKYLWEWGFDHLDCIQNHTNLGSICDFVLHSFMSYPIYALVFLSVTNANTPSYTFAVNI